jgi:hypothetical protein
MLALSDIGGDVSTALVASFWGSGAHFTAETPPPANILPTLSLVTAFRFDSTILVDSPQGRNETGDVIKPLAQRLI